MQLLPSSDPAQLASSSRCGSRSDVRPPVPGAVAGATGQPRHRASRDVVGRGVLCCMT